MDPEWIRAISGLWPLSIAIFFIVFVTLFRSQIRNLFDTFTTISVKRGETEVTLSQKPKEQETKQEAQSKDQTVGEPPVPDEGSHVPETKFPTSNEAEREWLSVLFSDKPDLDQAAKLFEKAQQAELDAVKHLENEALYLHLRYTNGDTDALTTLQNLVNRAEGTPAHDQVLMLLGHSYRYARAFQQAVLAYEAAAEAAVTQEEQAQAASFAAENLFALGQREEAFNRIMCELVSVVSPDAAAILYEGLASLYQAEGNDELRAIALDKALEGRPDDTSAHFNAAYSYNREAFNALALLHYSTLLRFKPDDSVALNNIGVSYKALDMPIQSIQHFRKAVELDNALAAANLAFSYIEEGFAEDALQVLNRVKQQDDLPQNVGHALAHISQQREAEEKAETETLTAAREQQGFLRQFAVRYFTALPSRPSFDGEWMLDDATEVTITQVGERITAQWNRGEKQYRITASTHHMAAVISDYSARIPSNPYSAEILGNKGYAYLSPNQQQLLIMTLRDRKHTFIMLIRKVSE